MTTNLPWTNIMKIPRYRSNIRRTLSWVTDLVQQRFPISWDFSRRPWCWLIQGMRMRGKQLPQCP